MFWILVWSSLKSINVSKFDLENLLNNIDDHNAGFSSPISTVL